MPEKILNQTICLKEYIIEKDYERINQLQKLCSSEDKVNLKLELDYRLNVAKNSKVAIKNINEFFYYVEETLVAYLCISSFGRNLGEINGVTHPAWRKKGFFNKLFKLAIEECQKRNFSKILLLTDGKSNLGTEFIKAVGGNYDFSEYRMEQHGEASLEKQNSVCLRKAGKLDRKEIGRQNALYFNDIEEATEEGELLEIDEETPNNFTYVVELSKEVIGKIKIEYTDTSAFIYGFGILPDFRGKGYAKDIMNGILGTALQKNVRTAYLQVAAGNLPAEKLYDKLGFKEAYRYWYRKLEK